MSASTIQIGTWVARVRGHLRQLLRFSGFAADEQLRITPDASGCEARLTLATFVRFGDEAMGLSDSPEPGDHFVVAIRLYRDAIAYAIDSDWLRPIWSDGDPSPNEGLQRLLTALGCPEHLERVQLVLHQTSLLPLQTLDSVERMVLATAMREICRRLVAHARKSEDDRGKQLLRRPMRIVLTLFFLAGLSTFGLYLGTTARDVARGKSWRSSSALGECRPLHLGGCAPRQGIFFHTKLEENPWIEYDLGKPTMFRKIVVENSRDGYPERAVPLIAEASDDRKDWREIARETVVFDVWTTTFPPVTARFVRFRVAAQTYLHLARVEIRN